jgi:hypothetical protein
MITQIVKPPAIRNSKFLVPKPSLFLEPAPQVLEPRYPEKHRVRAGGSIKGQAEGLTFYAARPRTSVSLSIAQRDLMDNL